MYQFCFYKIFICLLFEHISKTINVSWIYAFKNKQKKSGQQVLSTWSFGPKSLNTTGLDFSIFFYSEWLKHNYEKFRFYLYIYKNCLWTIYHLPFTSYCKYAQLALASYIYFLTKALKVVAVPKQNLKRYVSVSAFQWHLHSFCV